MAKKQQQKTEAPAVVIVKNEEVTPFATAKTTGDKYIAQARALEIKTEEDYSNAAGILTNVKSNEELAELEKNKVLLPAKQVVKAETARWKPIESVFAEINTIIRAKMKKWLDDKEAAAAEALKKLNNQISSGHITRPETIARKEDEIYSSVPAKTVYAGSGAASSKKIPKLKITNPDLVPDEYWVIDEVKLRKDVVTNDKIVPGAEKVYENSIAII